MLHIPDEHRFVPVKPIFVQDVMNLRGLVLDADVRLGDQAVDTEARSLRLVGVRVDGAGDVRAYFSLLAKPQKIQRVGQNRDSVVMPGIFREKNLFQLRLRHLRQAMLVEFANRQAKLRAELLQRNR